MSGAVKGDSLKNCCQFFALDLVVCVAGAQCWCSPFCALVRWWLAMFSALADYSRPAEAATCHIARSPLAQSSGSPGSFFHI